MNRDARAAVLLLTLPLWLPAVVVACLWAMAREITLGLWHDWRDLADDLAAGVGGPRHRPPPPRPAPPRPPPPRRPPSRKA